MPLAQHRRNRVAAWYELTSHPGLVLGLVVVVLYGPSLLGGFVLDDLRSLRLAGEYHRGERETLDLYRFLKGGPENRAQREAGWCPWWVGDGLRYQHFRPLSERVLYVEYLLFGQRAVGYRLVGLALYLLGVRLVLSLFRMVSGEERLSRWGALLFAVAACHAIPVTFISEQCDLIALVISCGAVLLIGRFVLEGQWWRLALGVALYGLGLLSKEAVLPVAVLPACFWLLSSRATGTWRRAVISVGSCTAVGLFWLRLYVAGQYGSNALMMLDPFGTPGDYLAALPGRAILLLSTWIIPVNPFLFQFHQDLGRWLPTYAVLGGVIVAGVALMYWVRYRSQRGVAAMSLWVLPFIPLLACTPPDDRVMLLPSIGFAYLGAVWMTSSARRGASRLRAIPFLLFVVVQVGTALAASGLIQFMEWEARRHLRIMTEAFGRDPAADDHLFLLNTARNFETLLAQDRLRWVRGADDMRVSILSDIARPRVQVVDSHTLRLETRDPPFFTSFVGLLGSERKRPRPEGEVINAGEFSARIVEIEDGEVLALELHFQRPLKSDSYRFFWADANREPVLWEVAGPLKNGGLASE